METKTESMGRSELESWLKEVLIPVEPNPKFIRELRGNLVHVTGSNVFSAWMLILLIAMTLLYITSWMGVTLRILLALIGIVGFIRPRIKKLSGNTLSPS